MDFFKKALSDAADNLKKSIEDSKNEMRKSLEDMKRSAMAGFGIGSTSSKRADDDVDDEPRISIGKVEDGLKEFNNPSSLTPPDKMEFEMFDESENEILFEHGFRFAQVPESDDVIYDIVNQEDSDLYLKKTNDNRYYRFYMYSPGKLCVDKDFRAYSKVEHTEFDLARYFKDYENDEIEGDSEYDVDKKLFYGVEKNTKATSQEYLPLDWEFVQFDEDENEYLGEHGFTYPRDTDVIYDIVGHDDYELFLVKTNNGRYFRFDPFNTGRLQIDANLNAYGIVEVTPFDFERFCKDYENDEVEEDLDEYEIEDKEAFYGCEQKEQTPKATPTSTTISESRPEQLRDDDSPDVYSNLKQKREELQLAIRHKNDSPEARENYKRLAQEYGIMREMVLARATSKDEIKNAVGGQGSDKSNDSAPQSVAKEGANENGMFSARMEALISAALQDGVLTEKEIAVLKKRAEKDGEDWDEVEMIINSLLAK